MIPTRPKLLIFGLDGATFDLIEPWIAEGRLPNLAALMAQGVSGRLQSTLQPITAPAWTTFLTGVNEGKHGIYNFVQRRTDSYRIEVTNGAHNAAATLFDIASHYGLRSAAINIPYTFPPRPIHGVMIGGPFTPVVSPQLVYPAEFFATLKQIAPDYFVMPNYDAQHADPLGDYAEKLSQDIELRERVSRHLLQQESWDVFMVVFMALDEAHHAFWHCMAASEDDPMHRYRHVIRSLYERADQAIGNLLDCLSPEQLQETSTFVVSDHGGGALRWMINLNRWLADELGVLQFLAPQANPLGELKAKAVKWAAQAYQRYVPPRVRASLRNRLGARGFDQVKAGVESALFTTSIDWKHTKAYAMGAGANIFINLKGREPEGIVEPGIEYEQLCQQITTAFLNLKDHESGAPIFKRVYRRAEIYHGPRLELAPDLIAELADFTFWGRGRYDSRAPMFEAHTQVGLTDLPLTGTHRPEGILIAQGRGIRQGATIAGARLLDMAPTLLGLLSIAPTPEMDGNVLRQMLTPEEETRIEQLVQSQAAETQASSFQFSSAEEEIISEHLRALGYL